MWTIFEVHRISELTRYRSSIILECIRFPIWSIVGSTNFLLWSHYFIIHQISDGTILEVRLISDLIRYRIFTILECIKFPIWSIVGSTNFLLWSNDFIIHQISDLNNFWGSLNFRFDPLPDFYHFGVHQISDLKHFRVLILWILDVEE